VARRAGIRYLRAMGYRIDFALGGWLQNPRR
jgi:hypothetical protein